MLKYPATLEVDDNDTILVSFRDFPQAHTFGEDKEEALERARDALATALEGYIADRRPIPVPSARRSGERLVIVPALIEAKVRLFETMLDQRIRKTELARRLGWHLPQVDRLLDLHHASRFDQLEAAFAALGKHIEVLVTDQSTQQVRRAARRAG